MTIHKLNPQRGAPEVRPFNVGVAELYRTCTAAAPTIKA